MVGKHTIGVVLLAAGILAASISVAQARPIPVGYTGQSPTQSSVDSYHPRLSGAAIMTMYYHPAKPQSALTRSVDPGNPQHLPVAATKTRPVPASSAGLDWTATTLLGATITSVVLLAAITGSRIRSRRVAQL